MRSSSPGKETALRWAPDLKLLRRAGKGIVVTFQGDDARQGDYCLAHHEITPVRELYGQAYDSRTDANKRRLIAKFERYADRIYALNPDLLSVLPPRARFLPYANVHLDSSWKLSAQERANSSPLRLLHAPTNRATKGTGYVLEAVRRLKDVDRLDVELELVEGVPRKEARKAYERADLFIDQLLVGWYGGLAVEGMALGKPVVCYLRDADLKHIPPEMRADLPLIRATPATLYDVLKEWATRRRGELRARAREISPCSRANKTM
jgi:hypothetical protein